MAMANPLKIHKTRAISENVFVCARATAMQSMKCCSLKIKTNKLKSHAYARQYFCGVLLCTVRVRINFAILFTLLAHSCHNRNCNCVYLPLFQPSSKFNFKYFDVCTCTWKEHINRMILYNKIKSVMLFLPQYLLCLHTLGWFTHARCAYIARSD